MCAHDCRVRASVQELSGCTESYAQVSKIRATLDVQVRTATNFLADQMLKTRAAENVLALMAATVSVMNEESNASLLASLFESAIFLRNLRELCSKIGETIFVRVEVVLFSNKYVVVDSSRAASTVPQVLIVNECSDEFRTVDLHNRKLDVDIELSGLSVRNSVFEGVAFRETVHGAVEYYRDTKDILMGP